MVDCCGCRFWSPNMVLYSGLSLYQAIGGYLSLAIHRTNNKNNNNIVTIVVGQGQGLSVLPYECCSIKFKFIPRTSFILHCSAMTATWCLVGSPFQ
jgi:hypothetical protein